MQTSFMHPPFGFALFFLRSVAPAGEYVDAVTGKKIRGVSTAEIYWGAIPFLVLQLVMVGLLIVFPSLVTMSFSKAEKIDLEKIEIPVGDQGWGAEGRCGSRARRRGRRIQLVILGEAAQQRRVAGVMPFALEGHQIVAFGNVGQDAEAAQGVALA